LRWILTRISGYGLLVDGYAGLILWTLFRFLHPFPPSPLYILPLVRDGRDRLPCRAVTLSLVLPLPSSFPSFTSYVCLYPRIIVPTFFLGPLCINIFLLPPTFLSFSFTRTVVQILLACYSQSSLVTFFCSFPTPTHNPFLFSLHRYCQCLFSVHTRLNNESNLTKCGMFAVLGGLGPLCLPNR
jgi:hypothetical protein